MLPASRCPVSAREDAPPHSEPSYSEQSRRAPVAPMKGPQRRICEMDFLDLEIAVARQRVKQAELSLERTRELFDEDFGAVVNIALCCRMRAEQQQLSEARERLMKIIPANEGAGG